ncbi:DUF982 domain-containing protein [Mesorhizobium sp. L-8-10]|uniref:DUF982 domain-containing protein n=1 Tax=Mesorhizobium sp. L-8-10 TaxID=2744523 RepID=UPI0019262B07|nr:DUF982 domain-containing protein [Mesorhizobium sp. L-8-10]
MQSQKFETPVTVLTDPGGGRTVIDDIRSCTEFLLRRWPGKRGDNHRAALQACSDASAGKKPIENARRAFALAARGAGILINP